MFEHADLKVMRASKHIREFHAEVELFIEENPHSMRIEGNPDTGNYFLHLVLTQAQPPDTSPIIGDAIHNLRSALDLAWYDVVSTFATPDPFTKFPFKKTRDGVAAAIKGRNIPPSCQAIGDFIMDVVKPYQGGNDTLWLIHYFDITDKHEFLIPNFEMTAITNIRIKCDGGTEHTFPVRAIKRGMPTVYTCRGCRGLRITNSGEISRFVLFAQGPLYGKPVEVYLVRFLESTTAVLDGFKELFRI